MPATRKINGKRYTMKEMFKSKAVARGFASTIRKNYPNKSVRVLPVNDTTWGVYIYP